MGNKWKLLRVQTLVYLLIIVILYCTSVFIITEFRLQPNTTTVRGPVSDLESSCPVLSLVRNVKLTAKDNISCKQHEPLKTGCDFARKLYTYDYEKRSCISEPRIEICFLSQHNVKCSYEACGDAFQGYIFIHYVDPATGEIKTARTEAKDSDGITLFLNQYSKICLKNGYQFLFISCDADIKKTQLILLPFEDTQLLLKKPRQNVFDKKQRRSKNININLVMIDSVARAHFYRSLKQTIDTFNKINMDRNKGAEVLDFELFQAVHGHSVDNAHALFTGTMHSSNYTDREREELPVGMDQFYTFFNDRDFHTFYQDDGCYTAVWGLRMDLGGADSWEELQTKIQNANIHSTGLTFASCKMLEVIGVEHIYNMHEDAKVCFNGKQNDAYLLEKLLQTFLAQEIDVNDDKNVVAYSALNVAHDSGGVRIQSIDTDLATFVENMAELENTLTIVFADHGNTYTDFVYLDTEGKYEMFHPSLFMVIPTGVQKYLGNDIMTSLKTNQNRLFTMLDLHYGLKYMIDRNIPNKGLADVLPSTRSCYDLPLRMPNFCVCHGHETPLENTTEYIGHLEFAVGQLNNIIVNSSNEQCKRLVPSRYGNILQRQQSNIVVTFFDIFTEAGTGFETEEKFTVEVKSVASGSLDTFEMEMNNYDRISSFGKYRNCSDANTKFRLCICDIGEKKHIVDSSHVAAKVFLDRRTSLYNIFYKIVREVSRTVIENKLYLDIRTYNEREGKEKFEEDDPSLIAVTFEAIYVDTADAATSYEVDIIIVDLNNMKPVSNKRCGGSVKPNSVLYLCTLMRKFDIWPADFQYDVKARKLE